MMSDYFSEDGTWKEGSYLRLIDFPELEESVRAWGVRVKGFSV